MVYFVVGCALAVVGWQAVNRVRARSLEQLVFSGSPPGTGWTVALIFTPKECPSRMDLVEHLNRLAGKRVSVRGIMLVDTRRFPGWRDAVVANRIAFPVRAEPPAAAAAALEALGGLPTPVLAVYDSVHRLRLVTDLATGESVDQLLAVVSPRPPASLTIPETAR
jgi:hypothetical protein